ncbi:MAG: pyridoxal 5'-phosphate synthase, partial [Phycisphaeraceae bacterium JB051]
MSNLSDMRRDFNQADLTRGDLLADPISQFQAWLDEAIKADILDPTAMTLATADEQGRPAARIVLLKGLDAQGLCFYTNYHSAKGKQLAVNPQAALVFYWPQMDR